MSVCVCVMQNSWQLQHSCHNDSVVAWRVQCTGQLCNNFLRLLHTSHCPPQLPLLLTLLLLLILLLLLHWQQTTRNLYARFLLLQLESRGVLISLCHVEWQQRREQARDTSETRLISTATICGKKCVGLRVCAMIFKMMQRLYEI